MSAASSDLAALRRDIDEIDDRLHDLLMQRSQLTARVQAAKGANGALFLRPGREAQILRRLLARHQGPLRRVALARLWRELVTGLYHLQGGLNVALYGGSHPLPLWEAARGHFGVATPIAVYEDMPGVLGAVSGSSTTIGVLPAPEEGEGDSWWRHLQGEAPGTPRVVARLPFVSEGEPPPRGALVIAAIAPEPSGQDVSLVVASVQADRMSRQRLLERVSGAGFAAQPLSHWTAGGDLSLLAEVEGFVAPDDPRLRDFGRDTVEAAGRAIVIGAHAAPIHYPNG
jgi:chorismate mutase/prephenate dehydratase